MPETLPTKIATQFAWAPLEGWVSTAACVAEYAAQAVARKRSPLGVAEDLAEFARVATFREKPTWANDPREVRTWPVARLLDYSAPSATAAVPTLVLPPQAGHAASIVDYGRDQSQMVTLRDAGLDRLFAVDWPPATDETANFSIEDYVVVLEEAVQSLGGRVNLVGDCQGAGSQWSTPAILGSSWGAPPSWSTGSRSPNACVRTPRRTTDFRFPWYFVGRSLRDDGSY